MQQVTIDIFNVQATCSKSPSIDSMYKQRVASLHRSIQYTSNMQQVSADIFNVTCTSIRFHPWMPKRVRGFVFGLISADQSVCQSHSRIKKELKLVKRKRVWVNSRLPQDNKSNNNQKSHTHQHRTKRQQQKQ